MKYSKSFFVRWLAPPDVARHCSQKLVLLLVLFAALEELLRSLLMVLRVILYRKLLATLILFVSYFVNGCWFWEDIRSRRIREGVQFVELLLLLSVLAVINCDILGISNLFSLSIDEFLCFPGVILLLVIIYYYYYLLCGNISGSFSSASNNVHSYYPIRCVSGDPYLLEIGQITKLFSGDCCLLLIALWLKRKGLFEAESIGVMF